MKLYGTAKSRAARSLVVLEELGVAYEHVPLFANGDVPADREVLDRLNPNGHVPVLEDGDLVVWESMAINSYLAERYGGAEWSVDTRNRALALQWSFWVQTEIDRPDWNAVRHSGDERAIEAVKDKKVATLGILDRALEGRPYLLGEAISLADLNVASSLSQPNEGGKIDWQRLDPAEFGLQNLADWLGRCTRRTSWKTVASLL